jgi:hypothetical protein
MIVDQGSFVSYRLSEFEEYRQYRDEHYDELLDASDHIRELQSCKN